MSMSESEASKSEDKELKPGKPKGIFNSKLKKKAKGGINLKAVLKPKKPTEPTSSSVSALNSSSSSQDMVLRNLGGSWSCVRHCGACCYLSTSERDIHSILTTETDVVEYLSMIGPDGWCTFFDKDLRQCTKYESRPWFCRVDKEAFEDMYGVLGEGFDQFAIKCCVDHITDRYGEGSQEMDRFRKATRG